MIDSQEAPYGPVEVPVHLRAIRPDGAVLCQTIVNSRTFLSAVAHMPTELASTRGDVFCQRLVDGTWTTEATLYDGMTAGDRHLRRMAHLYGRESVTAQLKRWVSAANASAIYDEVVAPIEALITAGLKVADDLDDDPEWARRQIRTALTTGAVDGGAPHDLDAW